MIIGGGACPLCIRRLSVTRFRREGVAVCRGRRSPGVWTVAVFLVAVATLTVGCRTSGTNPQSVSLAALATSEERYREEEVKTQGVVRRFSGPSGPYFVIEDAEHHRVQVLPASKVAGREGQRVAVVGTFGLSPTTGRVIHAHRVAAVDS